MTLNLDAIAGVLTGWAALCLFTLHVVSSPRQRNWMTIPEYVRGGFLVSGVMFTWRSANFFTVAKASLVVPGHVNAEGIMALAAITYTMTALAWWRLRSVSAPRAWDRAAWGAGEARGDPQLVPVMMRADEVIDLHRAMGTPTFAPGEGPDAMLREARRRPAKPH